MALFLPTLLVLGLKPFIAWASCLDEVDQYISRQLTKKSSWTKGKLPLAASIADLRGQVNELSELRDVDSGALVDGVMRDYYVAAAQFTSSHAGGKSSAARDCARKVLSANIPNAGAKDLSPPQKNIEAAVGALTKRANELKDQAKGALAAHKPPVILFNRGKKTEDYDELVAGLRAGATVQFSDQTGKTQEFRLLRKLGGDGSDFIFEIAGGKAVRIPQSYSEAQPELNKSYLLGFENLTQNEVRPTHIDVFLNESDQANGQFVVVKKENIRFTLAQLNEMLSEKKKNPGFCELLDQLPQRRQICGLDQASLRARFEELQRFLRGTARFESIADFKPANVGWVPDADGRGGKWVLFDWDSKHKPCGPGCENSDQTAIDTWPLVAFDWMKAASPDGTPEKLRQMILASRKAGVGIPAANACKMPQAGNPADGDLPTLAKKAGAIGKKLGED